MKSKYNKTNFNAVSFLISQKDQNANEDNLSFTDIDVGCQVIEGERICGQGIGPQTTLVNCADISIISKSIDVPKNFPWPDFTSKYDSMAHKG